MSWRGGAELATAALAIVIELSAVRAAALEAPIPRSELKSGVEFTSEANRVLQADEFANPGMLWVTRGEKLWREPAGSTGKSCSACHGDNASMKGVATRYPRIDPGSARLVNLAGRVNVCRERNQSAPPFALESEALLAFTTFVAYQSRGMPMKVEIDTHNASAVERGRTRFNTRMGQMNLACMHCHDRNWGRTLLHERISQGHGTGYPAYKQDWQAVGSLERRIRACYSGLRAEMPAYGARELVELELYLAWRGNGLPVEAPGVRR